MFETERSRKASLEGWHVGRALIFKWGVETCEYLNGNCFSERRQQPCPPPPSCTLCLNVMLTSSSRKCRSSSASPWPVCIPSHCNPGLPVWATGVSLNCHPNQNLRAFLSLSSPFTASSCLVNKYVRFCFLSISVCLGRHNKIPPTEQVL